MEQESKEQAFTREFKELLARYEVHGQVSIFKEGMYLVSAENNIKIDIEYLAEVD